MTKKIFAAALAASLALTAATVSPASALDRGETTRLILGVGTLFALGHALNQHNKGRTTVTRNTPPQRPTTCGSSSASCWLAQMHS